MHHHTIQREVAWAEDRATQRCDPSADPGAKTEEWAAESTAWPPASLFGIGTKAINLTAWMPKTVGRMPSFNLLTLNGENSNSR